MNCPNCNTGSAYVGFIAVECINDRCKHFSQKLYDTWELGSDRPKKTVFDMGAAKKAMEETIDVYAQIQQLVKALEAGNYNAAPSKLTQGAGTYLEVESLETVMQTVTFDDEKLVLHRTVKMREPLKFIPITFSVGSLGTPRKSILIPNLDD